MDGFLVSFADLVAWFLSSFSWDNVILTLPFGFVIMSMLILMFRKVVGLR